MREELEYLHQLLRHRTVSELSSTCNGDFIKIRTNWISNENKAFLYRVSDKLRDYGFDTWYFNLCKMARSEQWEGVRGEGNVGTQPLRALPTSPLARGCQALDWKSDIGGLRGVGALEQLARSFIDYGVLILRRWKILTGVGAPRKVDSEFLKIKILIDWKSTLPRRYVSS